MTDNKMESNFPLLKTVPAVLRARGYRLYTKDNRRLVDLWLNGGAAVLGHTPPNILRELKNTASRGLYAPFPHFTESRYLKALSKLLPNQSFRIYAAPPQELIALFNKGAINFQRPFAHPPELFKLPTSAISALVLPGVQTWREFDGGNLPLGLCVVAAQSEEQLAHLPPNDILPPVLLAAAARGVHDLLASPQRAKPLLPRTFKALKKDSCLWKRGLQSKPLGIYLYLKEKPDDQTWAALFNNFLKGGFLLPPTVAHPVILPGELSQGEDAKLAALLETISN